MFTQTGREIVRPAWLQSSLGSVEDGAQYIGGCEGRSLQPQWTAAQTLKLKNNWPHSHDKVTASNSCQPFWTSPEPEGN